MLGETDYKLLKQKTGECNKLISGISLVPHQVRLVKDWETKTVFEIVHNISVILQESLDCKPH